MTDNFEISIILPVYNVVEYLDECVQSILNQSYSNFELIIVDDGSTDGSQNICDKYGENDERIKVVHQKNAGLSSARNTGLAIAKGQYITFIDSDDFIDDYYIELLYTALIGSNSDISMCDYKEVSQKSKKYSLNVELKKNYEEYLFNGPDAIKQVYQAGIHGFEFVSWAKMYKVELFKSGRIFFPPGKIHEDSFTTYKLFYCSNNIIFINKPLYFYRKRPGSIMASGFSERSLDMIEATREEYLFFMEKGEYELMNFAFTDHLHKMKQIIQMIDQSGNNKEILKEICNRMDLDIKECKNYIQIPISRYLYYRILSKFPKLVKLIR